MVDGFGETDDDAGIEPAPRTFDRRRLIQGAAIASAAVLAPSIIGFSRASAVEVPPTGSGTSFRSGRTVLPSGAGAQTMTSPSFVDLPVIEPVGEEWVAIVVNPENVDGTYEERRVYGHEEGSDTVTLDQPLAFDHLPGEQWVAHLSSEFSGHPIGTLARIAEGDDPATAASNTQIINEALLMGGHVWLPRGRFHINGSLVIPNVEGAALSGSRRGTVLVQSPGANLDGMVVSAKWIQDATSSQLPCRITDLTLDGNAAAQSGGLGAGIVLMTFRGLVERVIVSNTRGDGFLLVNGNRSGVAITNDAVENRFVDCEARSVGGYGLHAPYTSGANRPGTTDTFVERFICQSPALGYIKSDRSGGWKVLAAHLYSAASSPPAGHGVDLSSCFGTTVASCNIDTWGGSAGATTLAGLRMRGLSGRASVVVGNVFDLKSEAAASDRTCIQLVSSSGQTPEWAVTGNAGSSRVAPSSVRAIVLSASGGGGANSGVVSDNAFTGVHSSPLDARGSAGFGTVFVENNSFNHAVGPPTQGYWRAGVFVRNDAPNNGIGGWVCTTAGTPGVWTAQSL